MPYRVEDSPNARAGCKNKECKDEGVKIQKGELRFASQVTIKEHTTWVYKHWGCVTPAQIGNWNEENGGDPEMVDGYDDLSTDSKAKVDYALKHGHVADEDWKGDVEVNRPGQKGFRAKVSKAKAPKKQAAEDEEEKEEEEEEIEVPKANGKRGRPKKETNEDQAPAPKKARGKKAAPKKEIDEDDVAEPELPKAKRGKQVAPREEVDENNIEELEPPKAKRGKKVASKKNVDEDDAGAEEPEPPKAKRGKKAVAIEKSEKTAPTKRSGRKKAAVNYEEE